MCPRIAILGQAPSATTWALMKNIKQAMVIVNVPSNHTFLTASPVGPALLFQYTAYRQTD